MAAEWQHFTSAKELKQDTFNSEAVIVKSCHKKAHVQLKMIDHVHQISNLSQQVISNGFLQTMWACDLFEVGQKPAEKTEISFQQQQYK